MISRIIASLAMLTIALAVLLPGLNQAAKAAEAPQTWRVAANDVPEKEAFEAAKELGTIEAWEAFLTNYSSGFRADLARAYVKRLGMDENKPAAAAPAAPAPVKPAAAPAAPQSPADLSLTITSNQSTCGGGGPCSYTVVATNVGGKPFTQQSVIAVGLAPGGHLTNSGTANWSCQGMAGGAVCFNPNANLGGGQSSTLSLTFALPRGVSGAVRSCTQISWGGSPSSSSVRDVQQALNQRGLNAGPADGQPGRKTVNAIRTYQSQNGLSASGEIDIPLIFSLFTQQGPGDANAANDKACIDTGLRGAPAAVYTPPPAPRAQPAPRQANRGCSGGRYYSKRRGRCVCPSSKPHFYNRRCYAGRDDCPGDSARVGNDCIKQNEPPVRQARPPRAPQPAPTANLPGVAAQIINQFQNQPCSGGRIRVGRKCKCPGGQTFSGSNCVVNQVRQSAPVQQTAPPPPPIVKQIRPQQPVAQAPNAPPAPPPPQPVIKKVCPGGLVPAPGGGCTTPTCGAGQIATPNGCINISDMRLKRDISHIATRQDGLKLYAFRYLWGETLHVGLMAQDLLASDVGREAVIEASDGTYAVDYARLGLRMVTLETWRTQGPASMELPH